MVRIIATPPQYYHYISNSYVTLDPLAKTRDWAMQDHMISAVRRPLGLVGVTNGETKIHVELAAI